MAAFMRMQPRALRSLLTMLVTSYAFPKPIPCTTAFDPVAVNNWFARQSGLVAVGNAATAQDGIDPFLQRERSRIEKTALHSGHQQAERQELLLLPPTRLSAHGAAGPQRPGV